jgi:hypothetical protein
MESWLMLASGSGFMTGLQIVEMSGAGELLRPSGRCLRGLDRSALAGIDIARCLANVLGFKV